MEKDNKGLVTGTLGYLATGLRGYALLIAVDSAVYSVCFMCCGVPWWLLFGVLAGASALVPVFGMLISAALTLAAVAIWNFSWWRLLAAAGVYLLYGCVFEQFFVYPLLVGRVLRLKTWEVLVALLAGLAVAGPLGMLLALPVWGTVKYIYTRLHTR